MAVRKAITRSKKTFRVKIPSQKNQCSIHCESMLEGDAARYFEISPHVVKYESQASTETYYAEDGEAHCYTPDFRVTLISDEIVDVEVKPHSKLKNPDIEKKLELIAARYVEVGRRFRVMTDVDLRPEPFCSNLRLLVYHASSRLRDADIEKQTTILKTCEFSTIAHVADVVGSLANVYRLIATGFLSIDFHQPIAPASAIWVRSEGDGDDSLCV